MTTSSGTYANWPGDGTATSTSIVVLDRADVLRCLEAVDVVEVVRRTLVDHDEGRCVLPDEAYLPWRNSRGAYTRSIAMPGAVLHGDGTGAFGLKVVNASVSNPDIGIERAGGVGLCFDPETARVTAVVEVALLSALRTAAVSLLGVEALRARPEVLAVVGCGVQGWVHTALFLERLADVRSVVLFDRAPDRAEVSAARISALRPGIEVVAVTDVRQAVHAGDAVVLTTTAQEPYVSPDWFRPGAMVVNVSLSDLNDEALLRAGALYVDDVDLVANNPRRTLGRLMAEGRVARATAAGPGKPLDGTIGGLLTGRIRARRDVAPYTVVNPFGMGVVDVALYHAVRQEAENSGLGKRVRL